MSSCKNCGSTDFRRNGVVKSASGVSKQKLKCKDCGAHSQVDIEETRSDKVAQINQKFSESADHLKHAKIHVFTSAQNDTPVNSDFLASLELYCNVRGAALSIIPIRYANPSAFKRSVEDTWDKRIVPYMMDTVVDFGMFKVLGDLKIQATTLSPLNGLEPLTQGKTTIVAHGQIQLKSCPRLKDDPPIVLTTTGSITENNYSETRVGYIADFNHSLGAVIVEQDEDCFHLRHISAADDGSFIDLDVKYSANGIEYVRPEALVLGDEHAWFADNGVAMATHWSGSSMVKELNPKVLVRHDIFDAYSVSHHHENNFFVKYKKLESGMTLERELVNCENYIAGTTPLGTKSVIVGSNHNSHLMKWLQEPRSALDIANARMHSKLKSMVLENYHDTGKMEDAFTLYMKKQLSDMPNVEFIGDQSYKIAGIEIALHGDAGPNGARGSAKGLSRLAHKSVIGHSHSPCIEKGCYQVGTSTGLNLEYAKGPTSWTNTHCLIHENGKRQLVTIINGKWRL